MLLLGRGAAAFTVSHEIDAESARTFPLFDELFAHNVWKSFSFFFLRGLFTQQDLTEHRSFKRRLFFFLFCADRFKMQTVSSFGRLIERRFT